MTASGKQPAGTTAAGLPTRRLGTTDMDITRVGVGAWAIGGTDGVFGWGSQDDRDSVAAIHRAVELGINWIDTAAIYGAGHSEQVVGQALGSLPPDRRPFVFTKCGLVWDKADPKAAPRKVGAGTSLRREVESSLRRLGVERIDLYQMHWPPDDGTTVEEYWGTLTALRREGKVRAVGLSNHDVAQLEAAEAVGHVDSLQPRFSAIARAAADDVLPWCAAHDTGVIVYSPMHSGLLSGRFSAERVAALPDDDWRRHAPEFSGDRLARNLELANSFQPVAERHRTTVAAAAIAWTLAWPGVTGAIVGARTPDQVDGWIDAATLELDPEDLREIAAAIERTGAGEGPNAPDS